MSAQENSKIARSIYTAYNDRRFDAAIGHVAPGAEIVNVATGAVARGPEGFRAFLEGWATAFPDSRVEVTNVLASGDQVTVEFMGRGTHTGPLQTPGGAVPGTGRRVEIHFCDVIKMQGGKVAGLRTYFDLATMMRQLGLLQAPEPAGA